jgi:hypothetical protein
MYLYTYGYIFTGLKLYCIFVMHILLLLSFCITTSLLLSPLVFETDTVTTTMFFRMCDLIRGRIVGDQNFQISRLLREGHAAVCIGALDLEPEAAGADMDTHLLNLLCRYVLREAPQLGGLLAAGAQPRRRCLVAVGEVLPGHSSHRRVHRHVARRRGRLMKDQTSACWSRVVTGQKNDDQVSW